MHERYLKKACRDEVTGFTGVCTQYVNDAYGEDRVYLESQVGEDGKLNGAWFDAARVRPAGDTDPG